MKNNQLASSNLDQKLLDHYVLLIGYINIQQSVLNNYAVVIESLKELSFNGSTTTATKANGLLDRFEKAETLLCLLMINKPVLLLEELNKSLQSKSANISGKIH